VNATRNERCALSFRCVCPSATVSKMASEEAPNAHVEPAPEGDAVGDVDAPLSEHELHDGDSDSAPAQSAAPSASASPLHMGRTKRRRQTTALAAASEEQQAELAADRRTRRPTTAVANPADNERVRPALISAVSLCQALHHHMNYIIPTRRSVFADLLTPWWLHPHLSLLQRRPRDALAAVVRRPSKPRPLPPRAATKPSCTRRKRTTRSCIASVVALTISVAP
jgi:hypothetical protein